MQKKRLFIGISVAILTVIIVVGAFAFLLNPLPEAPSYLKEESLAFVRDVIGLNLTEYQVVKFSFWPQDDVVSPNGPLYLLRYNLKSACDDASVDIFYTKSNGTYMHESYFDMRSNELFSPAYPGVKVLNWTRGFIERYTNYKNDAAYLLDAHKTIDSIDHIEPMNTTRGNMTLQITIKQFSEEDIYTKLQFKPINSTVYDDYDNAVTFDFHNGALLHFGDSIG